MAADHRKWLFASLALMALVSAGATSVAFAFLFDTYVETQEERLIGLVHSQARMIEAVAAFDQEFSRDVFPEGPLAATLSQVSEAYGEYRGFGATGEFVLGRRDGNHLVFLLSQRNYDLARPEPVPIGSGLGEPMRLALEGGRGSVVARDYRGVMVLAAYEWLPGLQAGFVAKMDLDEVRAPFIRAGMLAVIGFLAFLAVGGLAFRRISIPLLEHRKMSADIWKLSQAMEQNPLMVFITDVEGRIEYVNRRFSEATGYAPSEVIGRNPRFLKSGSTPRSTYGNLWRTILDGEVWRGELEDRRRDGTHFWAGVLIAPISAATGAVSHFVAIHEDITERKLSELRMRDAMRQAEVANRAKSELLANMSHELRTPLNAIIGFSNMITEQVFGPVGHERYEDYIETIHASGQHLLDLINDILDMSAIEVGKVEIRDDAVDPCEVCDAVLRLMGPRAMNGKVTLSFQCPPMVPKLRADARRLKQMLLNLLSNAVKFTPEDGRVDLSVRLEDTGGMVFSVADTGIGMDAAGLAKAMRPFGQLDTGLDRRYEGTGLGLPLTKGLAELHDGSLELSSRPGEGTVARLRLPPERVIATIAGC